MEEGYDNSEYAQEEDPDDQWEWDEDAQVWISATVAKGKGSPKSTVKCHLCGRHGQAVQGRYEQGEVFSLLQVWSHWCAMLRQAQRFNRETAKEAQPKAGKSKGKGKMHELAEENAQDSAPAQGEVLMPLISAVELRNTPMMTGDGG